MKTLIKIIIITFPIFIFSCKNENSITVEKIINLEKEISIKATDFSSDMKIIKLENSDSCLLANIRKIEFEDSLIFILDDVFKGIYIFSLDGELIKKFSKEGRGPGEYLSIDDFIIDKDANTLEFFDRMDMSIYKYRFDNFEFIHKIDIPLNFGFKFAKKGDMYFFQTNEARNKINKKNKTNSGVIAFNVTSNEVTPLFQKTKPENENQHWEFTDIFTVDDNAQKIFISLAWDKILYEITNEKVNPIIKIEASNRGYPDKILEGKYDDKISYLNSICENNKAHFFKLLMNNDKGLIMGYGIGYPPKECYYFDLKNNSRNFFTKNIINDYLPFPIEHTSIFKEDDGYLVSVLYPHMENINTSVHNHLDIKATDNPILFLFKLN